MMELPNLLLSYGINLIAKGSEYQCLCFAHDDKNPSMSVYVNGAKKYIAHCFSCGFHEDVIGTYCYLNGLNPKVPADFLKAKSALESGIASSGKPFATISVAKAPPAMEREFLVPPDDDQVPEMGWLRGRDGIEFGMPERVLLFRTPDGKPWFYEARYIVNGRKEPRCFTYGKIGAKASRWACTFPPKPRPIYGLDKIAATTGQIAVFEGARKAELAQSLVPASLACTAWVGGAGAWQHSDWAPVVGRPILLFPDADVPGRKAMDDLAQHLSGLGCSVNIVDDPASPDKWDICDKEWSPEEFIAWAKAHKSQYPAHEIPLQQEDQADASIYELAPVAEDQESLADAPVDERGATDAHDTQRVESYMSRTTSAVWTPSPADLFSGFVVAPLAKELLPPVVGDHIFDLAEVINTDAAFGAITAIATVAGLLDDRIKIHLNYRYRESARLWVMCCGEPSTKKSPIMDAVRYPLSKIKQHYAALEKGIKQRQEVIDARHKAKLKEYTEACIKSDDHDVLEPPPAERLERRRIDGDNLTREALEVVLQDMPSGVLIHADEMAAWIGSMDAYKAAGVKADRALWLRAYNGGPMQIDRVTRGSYLIENWSATISGGIQPSKLANIAGQLDDDGLLQRFLIVASNRGGGQGLTNQGPNEAAEKAWSDLLNAIVSTKPGGGAVMLSPEAAEIRNAAVSEIYRIINSNMISRAFCTALGKWEGTTGRMILIYHAIDCAQKGVHPENALVSAATAQMAIDYMMRHLLPHMVSFYEDGIGQSAAQDIARLLAGRIIARGDVELTIRELSQYGPHKWRHASEENKRQAIAKLIEYGWIESADLGNHVSRLPSRYRINPHVHESFAKYRAAEQAKMDAAREIGDRIKAGSRG